MKLLNEYKCNVKIGVQANPYQVREMRLCVTDDEIILSGTVMGHYMVIDFPLKKEFTSCSHSYKCVCEENEVELCGPETKGTSSVNLWITYQDLTHNVMPHATMNFNFSGTFYKISILHAVGEQLAHVSQGLCKKMVKCF